ncbi:MAG TPA: hypothetical protein VEI28_03255 [Thermodesulfovibrionales bacterium]|nr:hypothetical protein [Thermodesulfovibrionales bacterium]
MPLKTISLKLDQEEYERLKEHLSKVGDPDINVAYVLRAYIRDLNRTLPLLAASGWDLKNYLGLAGLWLRQVGTITDMELFARLIPSSWPSMNKEGIHEGGSDRKAARERGGDD